MHLTQPYNEPLLLQQIAEGDEQAFLQLFTLYSARIRPFARNITHSETDAEEVIQETFIRVWLRRDQLPEVENAQAWIFTIAAREGIRFMRRKRAYEKRIRQLNIKPSQHNATPLELTQLAEIGKVIQTAINNMPVQRKRIYQLSRDEGLKPAAIADQLSLSVGTVKNMLSHALADIRKALEKSGLPLGALAASLMAAQ